jgi:uncharacterized damage-inducible protein DinB
MAQTEPPIEIEARRSDSSEAALNRFGETPQEPEYLMAPQRQDFGPTACRIGCRPDDYALLTRSFTIHQENFMSLAQAMLDEFEHEAKTTRRFLERVPQDKLSWKPHEKSHTTGELALHIASVPAGVMRSALADQTPLPDFKKLFQQPSNVPEILTALERSVEIVRQELPKIDDARMRQTWAGTANGEPVVSMPRANFLRFILLNHWIHHRGQLGVHLRLLGAKVPSSYGPSGDEE